MNKSTEQMRLAWCSRISRQRMDCGDSSPLSVRQQRREIAVTHRLRPTESADKSAHSKRFATTPGIPNL